MTDYALEQTIDKLSKLYNYFESKKAIKTIASLTEEEAKNLVYKLKLSYENENRGFRLNYLGNRFKLTTKQEHKDLI